MDMRDGRTRELDEVESARICAAAARMAGVDNTLPIDASRTDDCSEVDNKPRRSIDMTR